MENEIEVKEEVVKKKKKEKKSIAALISFLLGVAYLIFLFSYFSSNLISTEDAAEGIGITIAIRLILPHAFCVFLAVIFNGIGFFTNRRGFVLAGAIFYAISAFLFIMYFMFVIIQTILSFIAYARMPKKD